MKAQSTKHLVWLEKENDNPNSQKIILNQLSSLNEKQLANKSDPLEPYLGSIITFMRSNYQKNIAYKDPMSRQGEINIRMRNILFNWFFEIHHKFKLKSRTIFLSSNIFDRYLEFHEVPRKNLQLVGIASFLIASKFEDIYPPEVEEFCFLCENVYTKK